MANKKINDVKLGINMESNDLVEFVANSLG
jgi:hypothetical protein